MSEHERLELRGLKLDWSALHTEQALARVQRRLVRRKRGLHAAIAGCALLSLLSIGVLSMRQQDERASAAVTTPAARTPLKLGDGSVVLATSEATELRVVEETPSRVQVELARGAVRCQVTPNPERAFVVQAGAVSVTVVGTEFVVERRGPRAWVSVTRGKVRVSWGDGEARHAFVSVGESGLYPPEETAGLAAKPASVQPEPSGARVEDAAPPELAGQASQRYRSHVARSDYPGAFAVLSHNPALAGDSVEELLVAADVARLSNHPAQAVPYLQRILREHARDDRAPLAAFTLGRTLSGLGRAREAMNTFARVRSTWPASPFAEDALVRQTEAAAKLGDRAAAARLAEQYDREYPKGRRRAEVRRHAGLE
jgi:transmembrane sensor